MKVTEVIVSAGRTFNHPFESYSNLKPAITLKATLDESDDTEACVKALQQRAERMVEDHKTALLAAITELEDMRSASQELTSLESQMARAQARLDELRTRHHRPADNLLTHAGDVGRSVDEDTANPAQPF